MKISSSRRGLIGIVALGVVTLVVVGAVAADKTVGLIRDRAAGLEVMKESDNQTYSCDLSTRYIDVSQCPDYATYANNENANSAEFFNEIIRETNSARVNSEDEIVIKIPRSTFYFFNSSSQTNTNGFIDLQGSESETFPNFTITGENLDSLPVFVDRDQTDKSFLLFSNLNENLKIANIDFRGNNQIKYDFGLIFIRDTRGLVSVSNVKCSGLYGDTENEFEKGGGCIVARMRTQGQEADFVEIKNSNFSDYTTGVAVAGAKTIDIHDNTFDNRNPCPDCSIVRGETNVAVATSSINVDRANVSRSKIRNNIFWQADGKSEGETAIGLTKESYGIDILDNIMHAVQDTGFIIGNHNPVPSADCLGAPKDVLIRGNKFYNTELASVLLMNNVEELDNGCTQESATMRDIKIIDNESSGGGGGIVAQTAPHSPIYNLEIANNLIKNIQGGAGPDYLGVLDSTCITLAGLVGEGNDYDDIKIHGNTLENCRTGIYFRASHWNDQGGLIEREQNYVAGQNRKNEYISVYDNNIKNDNPNFSEILVQEMPVRGVTNINKIKLSNNELTNISINPANGAKRCNASCVVNSDCVIPKTQKAYSGIQGTPPNSTSIPTNYPTSYSCFQNQCRNTANLNDDDCDLNEDTSSSQTQEPQVTPESGVQTNTITVTMTPVTAGSTIRYTTDGSDVTSSSPIYQSTFTVDDDTTIKAKAFKSGLNPSNTVTKNYQFPDPQGSTLVIFAKGTRAVQDLTSSSPCQNGYPYMVVTYDDQQIGARCLDSTYPSTGYTYDISVEDADPSKITIRFPNDYYVAGVEDRNLVLDRFVLNGVSTTMPNSRVVAKGQWTREHGCNNDSNSTELPASNSKVLNCTGYFRLKALASGSNSLCTTYDLANTFDSRDGSSSTDNRIKLLTSELSGGKLKVNNREIIADLTPSSTSTVVKCWGRVVNSSGNVVCASNQTFCTWDGSKALLKGQDSSIAGGCNISPGTGYKTQIYLQGSGNQTLEWCDSAGFTVTQN